MDVIGFIRRGEPFCSPCAQELADMIGVPLVDRKIYNAPQFAPIFYGHKGRCADCGQELTQTTQRKTA